MTKLHLSPAILAALVAATFFGASTPLAKQLVGSISPLILAGLLYLGSGIGLIGIRLIKDRGWYSSGLLKTEQLYFWAAIAFGGVLAPTLLMIGLVQSSASTTSLLLNLEAVLTAVFAWIFFKESTDRRIILGMLFIVAGGVLLTWSNQLTGKNGLSSLAIIGACVCWALDNNLTRHISSADAFFIAGSKGLVAGITNISLGLLLGDVFPTIFKVIYALSIGFLGYGVSLVLFVFALRGLGTARTGAYFSIAPFIGAAIAILFFHEPTSILFWIATLLLSIGVWIHLTEKHNHTHIHERLFHSHYHRHDEQHHQHEHDVHWDSKKPHKHPHQHEEIEHSHHHYPDIHHRHKHDRK